MASRRDPASLRPNELSVDLVPNRLEWLENQRPVRIGSRPGVFDPGPRRGIAQPQTRPVAQPPTRPVAQPGRRRGTTLSRILTAAIFLFIIVSRFGGDLGFGQATPSPRPLGAAAPDTAGPGHVVFGLQQTSNCAISDRRTDFQSGQAIRWSARFTSPRDGGERVRVRVLRGETVEIEDVAPSAPPSSSWEVLCSSSPLRFEQAGTYRLEVRDIDDGHLLASDAFTVR
jgi:hypothetical protein